MVALTLTWSLIIVLLDQVFKFMAKENLSSGKVVKAVPNILNFTYVENRGAAFGILQGQTIWFVISAVLVILGLLIFMSKKKVKNKLFIVSAILIIGGTVGNLLDRLFRHYVIDYLQLTFFPPVCNFADYCLTFGAVCLLVYIFKSK